VIAPTDREGLPQFRIQGIDCQTVDDHTMRLLQSLPDSSMDTPKWIVRPSLADMAPSSFRTANTSC
jgi:hypothetical protein